MRSFGFAGLLSATLLTAPAFAADVVAPMAPEAVPVESGGWTFTVAPYFWAAGISGDIAQFGAPEVHIDQKFGDILSDLDFAAMVIGEARYDRFSLFGDVIYAKISTDSATPRGIVAETVGLTTSTFIGTAGAGYSILKSDQGYLDIVGAVRVWSVDTDLSFSGGLLNGLDVSESQAWVDGLVGARGVFNFTPKIYLTGWGMVGAGGADIDWDVAAGLGYHFNDTWSAVLGYRALGVDYTNDDFVYDIVEQGPILGVVARF
ncbi:MAG: hypothetical protein ABWY13_17765 [Mesorhizobium sp.]|jgi:hypothetical protein